MNTARVVAGSAGSAGLRRFLAGDATRRRLVGELEAMLERGWTVTGCDLYRAKLKPGRKLSGWYLAEVRDPLGRVHTRHVAAVWLADLPAAQPEIGAVEDEVRNRGLAAPFSMLCRCAPEFGFQLRVAPLDERLPALPALVDPDGVAQVLGASRVSVETVRYRPGERHVLRYRAGGGVYYAKLYRDPLPSEVATRLARLERWLAGSGAGVWIPTTVAVLPTDRAVIQAAARGVRPPLGPVGARALGTAVASFQRAPTGLLAGVERPLATELAAVARAAQHIDALLPEAASSLHATLIRAGTLDPLLPAEPTVSLHGDCKVDHFVTAAEGMALIDLDRSRPGPASADLGKLLADLAWRRMATGMPAEEPAVSELMDGHADAGGLADPARVRLYEAVFLLKAAARRVALWRPGWEEETWRLVEAAERVLERAVAEREPAAVAR